ncbi:nuclear-interacting partner of ALK [Grus japonensis]|uniref:Nuclear-interacting partner of ALK n=1 Tax=Grus japonensis TaxID=30415 RepID=A0ABC9VPT1_GRUJA
MLKCSSCQAFLCVSLQLAFDFNKYRFAMLLVDEPRALLQDFLDRFQSLCQLELQLPSLRPEDVKNMSLTEEKISLLLQLIAEELEHKTDGEKPPMKFATEILQVHVPACILALCGWTCSTASGSVHLSVITCSRCMRKVGLWGFHQLESAGPELDSCGPSSTPPAPAERLPLVSTSPRRMLTRSQDSLPPGSEQSLSVKSCKVFRIFRQWECMNSS